jgi:hypothetical protein
MVDLIPILRTEINTNQPTNKVGALANSNINRIDKLAFLAAFKAVYQGVFSSNNIKAGFRATGLVPIDPGVVVSKLEIKPRTPSPPLPTTPWNPRTPKTTQEMEAQTTLIINRIRTHASSSPTPLVGLMQQFYQGIKIVMHSATLIAQHNKGLEAANAAASERKGRKRKRIQKGGTLSQEEAQDLIAEREALALVEVERREKRRAAGGSSRGVPHCRTCGEPGHNKRTCTKDAAASSN